MFPTDVVYIQTGTPTYDPATGDVTANETRLDIKAGVLSRGRTEAGGTAETYEIRLWIHHGTAGLAALPTTADRLEYGGKTWKVTTIDPTYSSTNLIASKITAMAE